MGWRSVGLEKRPETSNQPIRFAIWVPAFAGMSGSRGAYSSRFFPSSSRRARSASSFRVAVSALGRPNFTRFSAALALPAARVWAFRALLRLISSAT